MAKHLTKLKIPKVERRAKIVLIAGISLLFVTLASGLMILANRIEVFTNPIGIVLASVFLGAVMGAIVLVVYFISLLQTDKAISEAAMGEDDEPRETRLW